MQENEIVFKPQPNISQPETQIPFTQPTPSSKIPWLFVFLVILFLSVTGVLAYQIYQLKQQLFSVAPSPTENLTPLLTPSSTPTFEPTANWRTYNNTTHNISFKYPLVWTVNEQQGQKEGEKVFNTKIELTKDDSVITMYLNMDGIGGVGQTYDGEGFVLDGINLYQYSKSNSYNNTHTIGLSNSLSNSIGVFMVNDITYSITLSYPDSDSVEKSTSTINEFNQILSTFKFTD
ncbi:hypothetical protein KKG65_00025 [Patescibacteria group bacterium]|nr:hypothetical protein [Patescibacteria group bacterium]MBU1200270.1 hypothetical protein [Patescibacteria group bacterium]MBU1256784.1 hypothetical protein [Patescibacteria group bacterium]MBU1457409.1 hypothetical protein [Patescibacteria group bacterium]